MFTAQKEHRLAITGPYSYVRHPQYIGFIVIMLGFLLQWPTLITVVMFPILVVTYVRLAHREEREVAAELGAVWQSELAQIQRISFLMRPASHAGPRRCLCHSHADHSAYVTRRNVVKIATLLLSSVLALGLVAGPAAAAQAGSRSPTESGPANCALKTYTVTAVAPQFADVQQGRVTTRRLAGAVVYVQAQPGLTAEWLTLSLQRHLSAMQAGATMKDCPLADVRVGVGSAGAGFAIQLTAKNPKSAEEVLRRARLLRG